MTRSSKKMLRDLCNALTDCHMKSGDEGEHPRRLAYGKYHGECYYLFLTTYLFNMDNGGFFQHFGELFWSWHSIILKFPSKFEGTPKKKELK